MPREKPIKYHEYYEQDQTSQIVNSTVADLLPNEQADARQIELTKLIMQSQNEEPNSGARQQSEQRRKTYVKNDQNNEHRYLEQPALFVPHSKDENELSNTGSFPDSQNPDEENPGQVIEQPEKQQADYQIDEFLNSETMRTSAKRSIRSEKKSENQSMQVNLA